LLIAKPDFKSVFRFLNASEIRFVVVGGIAAGILGEPRATTDVDIITFMPKEDLDGFLRFAGKKKVKLSEKLIRKNAYSDAFFRVYIAGTQVDFILGESDFEFQVLTRAIKGKLYGVKIPVASPEDMILMKLVSGRALDLIDAKAIQLRYGKKLDDGYIEKWGKRLKVQRGRGHVIEHWKKLLKSGYRE